MNEDSLACEKRMLLRSISNNKAALLTKVNETPSIDNCHIASSYLELWRNDLVSLRKINDKLMALIDTDKYNTQEKLSRAECEITSEYEKSLIEFGQIKGEFTAI